MIWLLGNNLDFDKAKSTIQQARVPLLELSAVFSEDHTDWLKLDLNSRITVIFQIFLKFQRDNGEFCRLCQ
jgi:hypothetical protein